jgi:hypothetical protein
VRGFFFSPFFSHSCSLSEATVAGLLGLMAGSGLGRAWEMGLPSWAGPGRAGPNHLAAGWGVMAGAYGWAGHERWGFRAGLSWAGPGLLISPLAGAYGWVGHEKWGFRAGQLGVPPGHNMAGASEYLG